MIDLDLATTIAVGILAAQVISFLYSFAFDRLRKATGTISGSASGSAHG